jgi:malate dehydrogenase (oxaloacetate-decarboxylating)(NADP+)
MVDVGTNTQSILDDPAYIGIRQKRDRSAAYDDLVKELFTTAQKLYGRTVLLQVIDVTCSIAFFYPFSFSAFAL